MDRNRMFYSLRSEACQVGHRSEKPLEAAREVEQRSQALVAILKSAEAGLESKSN